MKRITYSFAKHLAKIFFNDISPFCYSHNDISCLHQVNVEYLYTFSHYRAPLLLWILIRLIWKQEQQQHAKILWKYKVVSQAKAGTSKSLLQY